MASYCASGIAHTLLISCREASLGFKPSSHTRIVWVITWIILKRKALRDAFFFFNLSGHVSFNGYENAWTISITNFSIPTTGKYQTWFDDWFGVYTNYLIQKFNFFNFYNFNIWSIFTQNSNNMHPTIFSVFTLRFTLIIFISLSSGSHTN